MWGCSNSTLCTPWLTVSLRQPATPQNGKNKCDIKCNFLRVIADYDFLSIIRELTVCIALLWCMTMCPWSMCPWTLCLRIPFSMYFCPPDGASLNDVSWPWGWAIVMGWNWLGRDYRGQRPSIWFDPCVRFGERSLWDYPPPVHRSGAVHNAQGWFILGPQKI